MDVAVAEKMARELMQHHGLLRDGWRFVWGRGRRQFGLAQVGRITDPRTGYVTIDKVIKLSAPLTKLNTVDEVRDTLLHEIAHALAGIEHGHDAHWQRMCKKIGARPERLVTDQAVMPSHRYHIRCTGCQKVIAKRDRRMAPARLKQAHCALCGPTTRGKRILEPANQ